jgi:hypothetical protein
MTGPWVGSTSIAGMIVGVSASNTILAIIGSLTMVSTFRNTRGVAGTHMASILDAFQPLLEVSRWFPLFEILEGLPVPIWPVLDAFQPLLEVTGSPLTSWTILDRRRLLRRICRLSCFLEGQRVKDSSSEDSRRCERRRRRDRRSSYESSSDSYELEELEGDRRQRRPRRVSAACLRKRA